MYRLGPVAVGATTIGGITAESCSINTEVNSESRSGEMYVRNKSIRRQRPDASFSTSDLAVALTACGTLGVSLAASPLAIYSRLLGTDGKTASGSVHNKYTIRRGLLVPTRLSGRHGDDASVDFQAHVVYDGANDPIVLTANQSLPSAVDDNRWTISTASIGGIGSDNLTGIDVDFGIRVATEGKSSGSVTDIWDTEIGIEEINPRITIRGIDPSWFTTIGGMEGAGVTNATVVFRKRDPDGIFTGNTLTLTASGLVHCPQPHRASGRGASECEAILEVIYDGVNAPIRLTVS